MKVSSFDEMKDTMEVGERGWIVDNKEMGDKCRGRGPGKQAHRDGLG